MPTQTTSRIQLGPEKAFEKCLIAFGQGLGPFKVQDNVMVGLRWRFLGNFIRMFQQDPTAWESQKNFILDCSRSIGCAAASKANSMGSLSVSWKDHVSDAVKTVVAQFPQQPPGVWCEDPPEPPPNEIE